MHSQAGLGASLAGRARANRAWIFGGAFLGIFVGLHSIFVYTLGLFIPPLQEEFGWTRAQASAGAAVSFFGIAVGAPLAGRFLDRYGSKKVAAFSLPALAAALACLSLLIDGFYAFVVLSFVLCIVSAGTGTYTFTRLIVLSFTERRGIALGGALTATGFGGALYPYLLMPLIAAYGWRAGYMALAIIVLLATPLVLYMMRRGSGPELAEKVSGGARGEDGAFRHIASPVFLILALMFFVSAFATLGTTVHFAALLFDKGWTVTQSALTAALIGWGAIAARVVVGLLLDRFNPPLVTASVFLVCAAGMAVLGIGGDGFVVLGAILAGVAIGTEGDLLAFMVARYFPIRFYGSVLGIIFLVFSSGGALGPLASGYLRDLYGNYQAWLAVSCACFVASALLVALLARTPTEAAERP